MPRDIYAFTLTTKQDCFTKDDCVFASDGDVIGRVLHRLKVDIDSNDAYYSYDVESTEETYQMLKNGQKQLYHVQDYHVSPCSVWYTRK